MSTFSGLGTSLSGLNASRRGMDITGKNIANASTDGYTRQRVTLEARGGSTVPALHSVSRADGGGVDVANVERLRDTMLEIRAHTEHNRQSGLETQQSVLARIEQAFGEPGETGLQKQLGEYWNGWHDVANRPGDLAARSQLLQRAQTVAEGFNQVSATLNLMWNNGSAQLSTLKDEVNTTAANVAELNQAIARATMAGVPSAELADRRDVLVVRLSELVGASGRAGENGAVDVFIGGTALVRGAHSESLDVSAPASMAAVTGGAEVSLVWSDGAEVLQLGGEAGAMVESLNFTMPGYSMRLDAVANTLIGTVNGAHDDGFDLDGAAGGAFFSGTGAGDFRVVIDNPREIAASGLPSSGGNLGGENADLLAELVTKPGNADAAYKQLVVDLGVEAQAVNRRLDIQTVVTSQVDASRSATAGVDLDEEMTNLIQFQHAYSGAARLMTAVDEMIDTLINRTGLVGR